MSMDFLPRMFPRAQNNSDADHRQALIRAEAEIGGKLFGPVPKGHVRQFFCLDERTWVWHEEWTDEKGERKVVTTRYTVTPSVVVKAQDGQPTRSLSRNEAINLYRAIDLYGRKVSSHYQQALAV